MRLSSIQIIRLVTACGGKLQSVSFIMRSILRRITYPEVHLEGVVDEPLERGKSTNHEDSNRQTVPQTAESNLAVDPADSLASALAGLAVAVEFRNHYICNVLASRHFNREKVGTYQRDVRQPHRRYPQYILPKTTHLSAASH
jgi:hypothetical protein